MPDRFRDAELADLETLVALDSDDEFLDVLLAAYAERDEEREEERLGRHWLVFDFHGLENKPPIAARKYRSNPCRRERGDKTRKSKVNKSSNSKMPTDVWARAKCSLCHVFTTTKIIKFSRAQAKKRKIPRKNSRSLSLRANVT